MKTLILLCIYLFASISIGAQVTIIPLKGIGASEIFSLNGKNIIVSKKTGKMYQVSNSGQITKTLENKVTFKTIDLINGQIAASSENIVRCFDSDLNLVRTLNIPFKYVTSMFETSQAIIISGNKTLFFDKAGNLKNEVDIGSIPEKSLVELPNGNLVFSGWPISPSHIPIFQTTAFGDTLNKSAIATYANMIGARKLKNDHVLFRVRNYNGASGIEYDPIANAVTGKADPGFDFVHAAKIDEDRYFVIGGFWGSFAEILDGNANLISSQGFAGVNWQYSAEVDTLPLANNRFAKVFSGYHFNNGMVHDTVVIVFDSSFNLEMQKIFDSHDFYATGAVATSDGSVMISGWDGIGILK